MLAHRTVIDKFAQLSDSDRSCVLGMLSTPTADQMTSKGSAHDQFYLALQGLGWARRAKLDDDLEALGVFAAWSLTPNGRTGLPSLMVGATINRHDEAYDQQLPLKFVGLAVKFAVGYALVHVSALSTVYGLTRIGVPLAPVQDFLSLGLIYASSAAGVYLAVTPWMRRQDLSDKLKSVGSFQSMASNYRLLCAYFAPFVFMFHVALENLIVRFDPVQAARLVGNPMARAAVMTALVCVGCGLMLPSVLNAKISRYLAR
jgi:hypothetical protein